MKAILETWHRSGGHVRRDTDCVIVCTPNDSSDIPLIAAAPALYRALRALTERLDAEIAFSDEWSEYLQALHVLDDVDGGS